MNSETLIITRLPAANAPARPLKIRLPGKFQAVRMPTTPSGWYCTQASPRSVWRCSSRIHSATLALVYFMAASGLSTSNSREKSWLR
ncbi:hypothetical protein D3C75_1261040 [compost metagenome]